QRAPGGRPGAERARAERYRAGCICRSGGDGERRGGEKAAERSGSDGREGAGVAVHGRDLVGRGNSEPADPVPWTVVTLSSADDDAASAGGTRGDDWTRPLWRAQGSGADGGRGDPRRDPALGRVIADELHLRIEGVARAGGAAPVAVAGDGRHVAGAATLRVAVGDALVRVEADVARECADAVDRGAHGGGGRRRTGEVAEQADADVAVVVAAHVARGDDRGSHAGDRRDLEHGRAGDGAAAALIDPPLGVDEQVVADV